MKNGEIYDRMCEIREQMARLSDKIGERSKEAGTDEEKALHWLRCELDDGDFGAAMSRIIAISRRWGH